MVGKKPKLTEQEFLRRGASGANGTSGTNGSLRPRLPEELAARLKKKAWTRRISVNALIIEILEKGC